MLPTPNIDLDRIPECQKYLAEGSHRRLYRFSPDDYQEIAGIWSNGEVALPGDPPVSWRRWTAPRRRPYQTEGRRPRLRTSTG